MSVNQSINLTRQTTIRIHNLTTTDMESLRQKSPKNLGNEELTCLAEDLTMIRSRASKITVRRKQTRNTLCPVTEVVS
jgi:hypothetical protein